MHRPDYNHGVGKLMEHITRTIEPFNESFAEDMYMLGLLHNIGEQFTISERRVPTVGGEIAHGNGYTYHQEITHQLKVHSHFQSKALDILNIALLHIDDMGVPIAFKERIRQLEQMYTPMDDRCIDRKALYEELKIKGYIECLTHVLP